MTRSVYIVGGAGTGKSTFMANLLERIGAVLGPLQDLHSARNAKALVTLRGHRFESANGSNGVYLGVMRDFHPGTDGLDRVSSPVGEEWLNTDKLLPGLIVSEGNTLATQRFQAALAVRTDLLLVQLHADPMVTEVRCLARGTTQPASWLKTTATRAANIRQFAEDCGARTLSIDSADPDAVELALDLAAAHLR